MRFRRTTLFLLFAAALASAAAPASAALFVKQKVSSSGQGQGMDMDIEAWTENGMARIEYLESNNPIMPPGSYLLTRDGGQTVYLVNPQEETYSIWDLNQIFAFVGQLSEATGGMMTIDFKDAESELLVSEPGGEILGHDTTHKSWRSAYTMDMKIAFMDQSNRMDSVTDAWITDDIEYPALGVWFTARPPTTGDPDFDAILTQNMEHIDGMVLKLQQHTTTTNKKGQTSESSTTWEVTELREGDAPSGAFDMPPDTYTETPLVPMADQAGDGEEGGPMDGLKGLFGRKKKKDEG
ncbi:MAG: hypothetical protein R2991_03080 [Thermoanaerobaculia bacterium]